MTRDNIYYLRSADYSALQAALDNPPEPNEKLRTLLRSDNIRRVVPPSVLSRHLGDDPEVVNLYQSLEDQARIAEIVAELDAAEARLRRMQATVKWFAILLAYAAIIFFAWQLGRGAF
jgi:hypothetical protein